MNLVGGGLRDLAVGDLVDRGRLEARFPFLHAAMYEGQEVGVFCFNQLPMLAEECYSAFFIHSTTALVHANIQHRIEEEAATNEKTLRILEDGVGLFAEEDSEAVSARYLDLAMESAHAEAGAVYVLQNIGDCESGLVLDHVIGIPEPLLDGLLLTDGSWWPEAVLSSGDQIVQKDDGAEGLPGFQAEGMPEVLRNAVASVLSYRGVTAGICLLFNATSTDLERSLSIKSLSGLHMLGAALFKRRDLERQALKSRAMESELELAAELQQGLQPAHKPDTEKLGFAWRSEAAMHIGGDYIECLEDHDGSIHLTLADVSGHGVRSALLMTSFRASYRSVAETGLPDDILTGLNRVIQKEVGSTGMFLTAASVCIDEDAGYFTFASAGHNAVYLLRAEDQSFVSLEASGPPLGFFPDMEYESEQHGIAKGDVLLLYSDGIVEAQKEGASEDEDLFGEERLRKIVVANAARSAEEILEAIYAEVREYTGKARQEDDASVIVVKVR